MTPRLFILLSLFLLATAVRSHAQINESLDSVTIYGVVLDAEDISPVTYASVYVKNKPSGAVTDSTGYFYLEALKSDTLLFSAVGFKKGMMVLPANLPDARYSMVQLMVPDTLILDEVVVVSYPTISALKEAFMATGEKEEPQSAFAMQMELDRLLYETYQEDQFYYDQMRYNRLYRMTGVFPPNNFINPVTWTNFIRDWRAGRFETEAPLPERMLRRGVNLIDDDQ